MSDKTITIAGKQYKFIEKPDINESACHQCGLVLLPVECPEVCKKTANAYKCFREVKHV